MTPILASGISSIIVVLFLVPLFLAVFSVRSIAAATGDDRAMWVGLIIRLVPVVVGSLLLVFFLTVRGGAPVFFIVVAAFPFVFGILSLYLWGRKTPGAAPRVAIALRVILYGGCAVGIVYLGSMLLGK